MDIQWTIYISITKSWKSVGLKYAIPKIYEQKRLWIAIKDFH